MIFIIKILTTIIVLVLNIHINWQDNGKEYGPCRTKQNNTYQPSSVGAEVGVDAGPGPIHSKRTYLFHVIRGTFKNVYFFINVYTFLNTSKYLYACMYILD